MNTFILILIQQNHFIETQLFLTARKLSFVIETRVFK